MDLHLKLRKLQSALSGDLSWDDATLLMYATDASVYREKPLAVARPKDEQDISRLIGFAREEHLPLIPRTAGTSLAGQVVGRGIIVDVSRYMTKILEINEEAHWVRVQPGVVLDELNKILEPKGLFFGPETSTSNRCMVGGMVGNNSCGAHSLVYGSTRDHTLEVKGFLSDGSLVSFKALNNIQFEEKCTLTGLEGEIYRNIKGILSDPVNRDNIRKGFPLPSIKRRNTGYAIDLLLDSVVFQEDDDGIKAPDFNFCKLIAGSEGTLMFMTEITLNLVPLPPAEKALVCIHCKTLEDAFRGNLVALQHQPSSIELIDRIIIDCTRDNIEQRKNRFFIEGEPEAILIVEFERHSVEEIDEACRQLELAMREAGYGYHFPVITGSDMNKVWALRKAGLGLLSNVPGDAKPVTLIEDTAVRPEDLPAYMQEFKVILEKHGLDCVYYAHIATGELHLKPVLDLKKEKDVALFRILATEIAALVKKFRGSLSGEHGDGRLRGEFVPYMIGEENYSLLLRMKQTWDPEGIFNPGKITATPPMDRFLRYEPGQQVRDIPTYFDYSGTRGILRAVEQCNGSGDCRKSELIGGTMCPSYMATRDESNTTRARANLLREFLTHSPKTNPFDHREIKEVLDLCLSCKGCKSECPSNVDMAKYKAEFLQHYHDAHGVPLRTRMIAHITAINRIGSLFPAFYNLLVGNVVLSAFWKKLAGFAPKRSIPRLYRFTLKHWMDMQMAKSGERLFPNGRVYLFCDEFTNYNDVEIGIKTVLLLQKLGYEVVIPAHVESGRAFISKGLLKKARLLAEENVRLLSPLITASAPLLGIEPSGILTFRDEYPELVNRELATDAEALSKHCLLVDEFLAAQFEKGEIRQEDFTSNNVTIKLHGHCQQKALVSNLPTRKMLEIPVNYRVEEIRSGCCGMAGSFGYEKEHYELSMKVGELVLFPAIRNTPEHVLIAAPGTSCRHQIHDGTGRKAYHPVEVLYEALIGMSSWR
ncbi:MAG TPA: FAD-linked oxidase C-terminal domain-containing protein [Bacteroidales bacterium]|nr:FAD-linked oxidase C-terminal domain-containing protein [Bacteroidales bacterium]HSA42461.1 FAD-linked oxidase C-terminal domain-containing protein [Bacteroidales bacterium]